MSTHVSFIHVYTHTYVCVCTREFSKTRNSWVFIHLKRSTGTNIKEGV